MNSLITLIKKQVLTLGFIASISTSSLSIAGLEVTDPSRLWEVTTVNGETLSLLGEPIADYSVMALDKGKLVPIPFQFDEKNLNGFTFVPGGNIGVDGTENVIDGHDELVFLYRDLGPKADAGALGGAQGSVVSELEITEGGSSRYAYLVKGNSERSDKVYSHYDSNTGLIKTETYTMQFDPENVTVWSDWKIKGFSGTKSAPNVLDTMKARFFIKKGFIKATIHNGLLPAKTVAVKNGPIQSIIEADLTIGALGITILSGTISPVISPHYINFQVSAFLPKAVGMLSQFNIDATMDYVDFEGTKFRSPLGPEEPLIAGQRASDEVRAKYQSDLQNPWVSISSGRGFDVFFVGRFSDDFKPEVNALWLDAGFGDELNEPENIKGSSAEMGLRMDKLPAGQDVAWEYGVYFGTDLWQGNNPKPAADKIFNPAKVTVNKL